MNNNQQLDAACTTGLKSIRAMKEQALSEKPGSKLYLDWAILKQWLGHSDNDFSDRDESVIKNALKSYYCRGISPSKQFESLFKTLMQEGLREGFDYRKDLPPEDVINVFDHMISGRIINENNSNFNNVQGIDLFTKQNHAKDKIKHHDNPKIYLSKKIRLFLCISFTWFIWVILRSTGDYEITGFYLDQWDEDMLFFNLSIIPFVLVYFNFLYNWINKAK